jgi:glycosyltransferase involved in cell wall biosynthesis
MKKIVHVISSLHRGGAETLLLSLVRELQNRGWRQTILYIYDGPIREELELIKIPCYSLYTWGNYLNPLMWYRVFSWVILLKPNVMHTSLWAANFMGRIVGCITRIPTVASLHTVAAHEGKLRNIIDRLLPIHSRITIAVSQSIANSIVAARICKKNKIVVIPNAVDVVSLKAAAHVIPPAVYTRQSHEWVIGSVGRLVPVKRFDLLIKVFARFAHVYPNARLLIIGSGPIEHVLRAFIAAQSCAMSITLVSHQKSAPYYRYIDCFVQCSAYEGLSLALLEALAMKLPVIVTGRHDEHEVITHGVDGIVIPVDDEQALYDALVAMMTHPEQANIMGATGNQKMMRSYTLERMVDAYEKLFIFSSSPLRSHK